MREIVIRSISDADKARVCDEAVYGIVGLLAAAQTQTTADLQDLLDLTRAAKSPAELLGYSSVNRLPRAEAIETPIAGAYYASLASYRRDEEPQDDFGGDLPRVVELLDQIRNELLRLGPALVPTLRRGRQTVGFARAWTTLWLALDAVPVADLPGVVMFSPISPFSRDPQGDSQVTAEDHFGDGPEIGEPRAEMIGDLGPAPAAPPSALPTPAPAFAPAAPRAKGVQLSLFGEVA